MRIVWDSGERVTTKDIMEKLPGIKRGDVVTLIGRDGCKEITAEQAVVNAGTITNELFSRLSESLERVFLPR